MHQRLLKQDYRAVSPCEPLPSCRVPINAPGTRFPCQGLRASAGQPARSWPRFSMMEQRLRRAFSCPMRIQSTWPRHSTKSKNKSRRRERGRAMLCTSTAETRRDYELLVLGKTNFRNWSPPQTEQISHMVDSITTIEFCQP